MIQLKIKKLNESAKAPFRADSGSSGFDLFATENVLILPGEKRLVGTGLAMEVPVNYEIQIRPRSGLAAKNGVTVLNTPGTVDSSYRGEVKVILFNASPKTFEVKVGDRIAQAVVMALPTVEIVETDELSDTSRGSGGFGSTGK
jgi:dUTP pyrophosphatase